MSTKHATTCKMTFGRKDPACPRCQELLAGAKPRAWGASERARNEAAHLAEIRAHDCKKSGCGVMCTHGDW